MLETAWGIITLFGVTFSFYMAYEYYRHKDPSFYRKAKRWSLIVIVVFSILLIFGIRFFSPGVFVILWVGQITALVTFLLLSLVHVFFHCVK